ncbi:divergent polysaccharide deacetylase family protein [Paenibacillus aquistagni]|uniref:divergent polysaccharide deacetylase family protein n=1 Tax=Paenibacillus aquistagni TaxID=1852522 RepID=UPI000B50B35E|nr:divergent polysaccharide deacetylase family protein [Paenibacillus aquistagni]
MNKWFISKAKDNTVFRHCIHFYSRIVLVSSLLLLCFTLIWGVPIAAAESSLNPSDAASNKKVAIVIDDFGNRMKGTAEMMKLPVPITVAVMPFLPSSIEDAEMAYKMGHEVIVHMPMEPKHGRASWLGPGAILSNLSDEEIEKRVREAIDAVPHAVGMNNHMGSKITGDKHIMGIILRVCKEKGLYYLDSKTNYRSVAGEVAEELNVPIVYNQVFLDDVHTEAHVTKQWEEILKRMTYQTSCVTIGHVGHQGQKTAAVLHRTVPKAMKAYQFVRISELAYQGKLPLQ